MSQSREDRRAAAARRPSHRGSLPPASLGRPPSRRRLRAAPRLPLSTRPPPSRCVSGVVGHYFRRATGDGRRSTGAPPGPEIGTPFPDRPDARRGRRPSIEDPATIDVGVVFGGRDAGRPRRFPWASVSFHVRFALPCALTRSKQRGRERGGHPRLGVRGCPRGRALGRRAGRDWERTAKAGDEGENRGRRPEIMSATKSVLAAPTSRCGFELEMKNPRARRACPARRRLSPREGSGGRHGRVHRIGRAPSPCPITSRSYF